MHQRRKSLTLESERVFLIERRGSLSLSAGKAKDVEVAGDKRRGSILTRYV